MNTNIINYLIIPIVVLLMGIFGIFNFISPLWSDIQVSQALKADLLNQAEFKEKLAKNLENLASQYKNRRSDIEKVNQIVPQGQDFPSILVMLEALASENGLIFKNVGISRGSSAVVDSGSAKKSLQSSSVTLSLTGSYQDFKNYLKELEKNLRIFDIQSIGFFGSTLSTAQALNAIDFGLTLDVYYQ